MKNYIFIYLFLIQIIWHQVSGDVKFYKLSNKNGNIDSAALENDQDWDATKDQDVLVLFPEQSDCAGFFAKTLAKSFQSEPDLPRISICIDLPPAVNPAEMEVLKPAAMAVASRFNSSKIKRAIAEGERGPVASSLLATSRAMYSGGEAIIDLLTLLNPPLSNVFQSTETISAKQTDVLLTNMRQNDLSKFNESSRIGDYMFLPNGGHGFKDCTEDDKKCLNEQAVKIYGDALQKPTKYSIKMCSSISEAFEGNCEKRSEVMLGNLDTYKKEASGSGIFYFSLKDVEDSLSGFPESNTAAMGYSPDSSNNKPLEKASNNTSSTTKATDTSPGASPGVTTPDSGSKISTTKPPMTNSTKKPAKPPKKPKKGGASTLSMSGILASLMMIIFGII